MTLPGAGQEISLEQLSRGDIESLLTWRYPGEYALYDLAEADRATFLDPANEYLAIRRGGALTALQQRLGAVTFRAVIKDWNTRAQRAAEHAGFRASGRHQNDAGAWVLLTREPGRTA